MRLIILCLISLSLLNATSISVKDAWQKVLHINEGLKASQAEVTHAMELSNATDSLYLPEISVSASYTRLERELEIHKEIDLRPLAPVSIPFHLSLQDQDVFMSSLSVLWPLYTGGRIEAASDAYEAKQKEAEAKHSMEKDKTFLKLIKTYYGVVMSKALLNTKLEAQNALQVHFENAQKLKEQGQIATIELLNAQVELDLAKIQSTKAKHKYEITKLALEDMIGSSELPASGFFIDKQIQDQQTYKTKMLKSYAGLDVIKSKKAQINSRIVIEKAAYYPTFFAFGNYLLYKDDSPLMDMTPDWMVGIGVKFNILSREGKSEKLSAAQIMKSRLAHTLKQAQNDLVLLVSKTYQEMLQYKEEYQALGSSLALAHENLRLREIAFKEGLATSVDVIDAQTLLAGAKTKRLYAMYNYIQKISQLAVLSGNSEQFFEVEKTSMEIK